MLFIIKQGIDHFVASSSIELQEWKDRTMSVVFAAVHWQRTRCILG